MYNIHAYNSVHNNALVSACIQMEIYDSMYESIQSMRENIFILYHMSYTTILFTKQVSHYSSDTDYTPIYYHPSPK